MPGPASQSLIRGPAGPLTRERAPPETQPDVSGEIRISARNAPSSCRRQLLRGTTVNGTYGTHTHKPLRFTHFYQQTCGPIYYAPPVMTWAIIPVSYWRTGATRPVPPSHKKKSPHNEPSQTHVQGNKNLGSGLQ